METTEHKQEPFIEDTEEKEIISFDKRIWAKGVAWNWVRRNRQDTFAPNFNPWRALHSGDCLRYSRSKSNLPPPPEALEELDVPDPKVWYQVSRKFRHVARLPEGMTPQQALLWAQEEYAKIFPEGSCFGIPSDERSAKDMFLRTYTSYPFAAHLHRTLSVLEFAEFRKRGGQAI